MRDVPAAPADGLTVPFAGVPFLIKDLAQDYAGLPTSSGPRALMPTPVAEHATIVARWLDAGLVIFGKTSGVRRLARLAHRGAPVRVGEAGLAPGARRAYP